MPRHHPTLDLLTEHAAGSLSLAQSACLSAHLNYCDSCARTVSQLQAVGAALFDTLAPEPVGDATLDRVLARLDEEAPLQYQPPHRDGQDATPALLRRLMAGDFSDLSWKKITGTLRTTQIRTGDPAFEFSLLHILAGGEIPGHQHRGSEMTLVLQGGFADNTGTYHAGDFVFRSGSDEHSPRALPDEDCICLAVLDAPLKFTGWKHRWMNPFLRLQAG
ncbi:MAG: ChrR family anti-sigma-E factor [Halieaceae bacterium]|jgi:putative transcriptional regulator|nr:ChrR family anti-sigma-E factor [Halieaceae bacterium]